MTKRNACSSSLLALSLVAVTSLATGCSSTDTAPDRSDESANTTSIEVGLTMDPDTDVSGFRFDIDTCDGADVTTSQKALADMRLPGGITKFENAPYDADSEHLFTDNFELLDAGCYDVTATPTTDAGEDSEQCQPAHADNVQVEDGQTTEIFLISQCEGVERGGLDVISSINHPPAIESMDFEKFTQQCRQSTVCATISDPDDDPVDVQWDPVGDAEFVGEPAVNTRQVADGRTVSCVTAIPANPGTVEFDVTAFDMDGNGERMESNPNVDRSRESLRFPLHVGDVPELATCEGAEPGVQEFLAILRPLNTELNGRPVTGISRLTIDEDNDTFRAEVRASGLETGMIHPQHIHELQEGGISECPPEPQADTNDDGVVDVLEGLPFYGAIEVPLDGNIPNLGMQASSFPVASGPEGTIDYSQEASLAELRAAVGANELDLADYHVVLHGVDQNAGTPASAQSVAGLPAYLTMPVACGKLVALDD